MKELKRKDVSKISDLPEQQPICVLYKDKHWMQIIKVVDSSERFYFDVIDCFNFSRLRVRTREENELYAKYNTYNLELTAYLKYWLTFCGKDDPDHKVYIFDSWKEFHQTIAGYIK
jgi:hypothetical protein